MLHNDYFSKQIGHFLGLTTGINTKEGWLSQYTWFTFNLNFFEKNSFVQRRENFRCNNVPCSFNWIN